MAKTAFATGNALTKKAWEETLYRDTLKESYFSRFMGSSADSLVQVQDKLTKEKGDKITFGIRMRLSGAGVTEGSTLEGNEEKLTTYDHSILLEEYRHAVRDSGPLDRQRVTFSIDEESVAALKGWGAEKIDALCFAAIGASPTRYFSVQSGTITTGTSDPSASVTATDLISVELLDFVKTWARTGGNRTQTPLRPIKVDGKNYYVVLVHPDVLYDLRRDSTWAQAAREALERGPNHPLFTGASYLWNGMVIHDHENISLATDWGGASVSGAKCVFMGAQALVWANGMRPKIVAEEFDYGNEHGYAWGMLAKTNKPKFNSLDYGSVAVWVARTKISDA